MPPVRNTESVFSSARVMSPMPQRPIASFPRSGNPAFFVQSQRSPGWNFAYCVRRRWAIRSIITHHSESVSAMTGLAVTTLTAVR